MVSNLRVKKVLMALGGLVAAAVLAAVYYGYQLTRQEETGLQMGVNTPDSQAVARKLKLLQDSQSTGKKGYVRLSEVEINSFLQTQFNLAALATNAPPAAQTARSYVDLTKRDIVWYSYIQRRILGQSLGFLWERTVGLSREDGRWGFPVKSMRVGDVEIPRRFWPRVENFFEGADGKYKSRIEWIEQIPYLELTNNELSQLPELRVYNYNPRSELKK